MGPKIAEVVGLMQVCRTRPTPATSITLQKTAENAGLRATRRCVAFLRVEHFSERVNSRATATSTAALSRKTVRSTTAQISPGRAQCHKFYGAGGFVLRRITTGKGGRRADLSQVTGERFEALRPRKGTGQREGAASVAQAASLSACAAGAAALQRTGPGRPARFSQRLYRL